MFYSSPPRFTPPLRPATHDVYINKGCYPFPSNTHYDLGQEYEELLSKDTNHDNWRIFNEAKELEENIIYIYIYIYIFVMQFSIFILVRVQVWCSAWQQYLLRQGHFFSIHSFLCDSDCCCKVYIPDCSSFGTFVVARDSMFDSLREDICALV